MRLLNFSKLLSSLPLLPITVQRGGNPVVWASLRGLQTLMYIGIVVCLIIMVCFLKWYHKHPVSGKIALWILIVWAIWWLVRYIKALSDDPLLRATPYRKIEIQEEEPSFPKK